MAGPILLNSCARAATAAEARFRIDAPVPPTGATRVVALDACAERIVREVAAQDWYNARFFSCDPPSGADGEVADMALRAVDGATSRLSEQLAGADVAVMVATSNDGAAAASAIGAACGLRGIMTAGLVLGGGRAADAAVSALRPHARVLMVTRNEQDVAGVLVALRA